MVQVNDQGKMVWCPFEYEYLPDFCYVCGLIGHQEKVCSNKLKRGEEPQYGKWMRWIPPKKQGLGVGRKGWQDRTFTRGYSFGSGGSGGSDAPSWRKSLDDSRRSGRGAVGCKKEGSSPRRLLIEGGVDVPQASDRRQGGEGVKEGGSSERKELSLEGGQKGDRPGCENGYVPDLSNNMLVEVEVQTVREALVGKVLGKLRTEEERGNLARGLVEVKPKQGTFKRRARGPKGEKGTCSLGKEKNAEGRIWMSMIWWSQRKEKGRWLLWVLGWSFQRKRSRGCRNSPALPNEASDLERQGDGEWPCR
jgi:hypothetical protein